jgi:hypothetical protein
MRVTCPLVVVDDDGVIEWEANGWPDVTPFYGSVDTSNMPDVIRDEWHRCCSIAERQWECS